MAAPDRDQAIARAAELLGSSAFPVIAGLDADVAGIVAAVRLARRLGGAIDHADGEGSLTDQAVLADAGLMLVSPAEARQRADTVLLVGDGPLAAWPDLPDFLLAAPASPAGGGAKRVLALSAEDPAPRLDAAGATWLRAAPDDLAGLIGALRARVNSRPAGLGTRQGEIEFAVETLRAAKYGVAVWSPAELDPLTLEMLAGLVKDLNAETRWSGISVAASPSATAAGIVAGWTGALPLRTSWGRGRPEHDSWRFNARRLVESGEADAAVWITSFGEPPPDWLHGFPTVLLANAPTDTIAERIALAVGRPGVDHDAVLFDRRTGTLVEALAASPRDIPTAAAALDRIAAMLARP